jgi:Tol biopolymer transport system component
MKYLFIFLTFITAIANSQTMEVVNVEKLQLPGNQKFYHPKFDHSGTQLLLTSENYKGLNLLNLETNNLTKVSEADGAGYSPVFSFDNQTIVYIEQELIDKRRHSKLQAWSKPSGQTRLLEPAARTMSVPMVAGNRVLFRANENLKSAVVDDSKPDNSDEIYAGIENQQLVLYRGEERLVIKPYESESYIWPSVSPDRKHVMAYAMGKGAFICDLTGMVIAEFGEIEAPAWAGNDFIVGMVTKDDGHQILASSIVAVDPLSGERKTISPENIIAMHPTASAKARKIAFHTLDGEIYFIHYQLNR